jgi:hypothetical protein
MEHERRGRRWEALAAFCSIIGLLFAMLWKIGTIAAAVNHYTDFFERIEDHMCRVEAHIGITTEAQCHQDFHPGGQP